MCRHPCRKIRAQGIVIAGYSVTVGGLALGVCLLQLVHAPNKSVRFSSGEADYISALEARGLTRGYAGYWQASDTTVATGGEIKIAALVLGKDGKLSAYDWFANKDWYDGAPTSKRFFVSTSTDPVWPKPGAIVATFGKPDDIFIIHNAASYSSVSNSNEIITYIYNRPLPGIKSAEANR